MILDKPRASRALQVLACVVVFGISGCSSSRDLPADDGAPGRVIVACTISTLCALVTSVGGSDIDLRGIVPVGASPETYEPAPSDVVAVSRAKLLFENGLGLEAWLQKLIDAAAPAGQIRVTLSDAVPAAERASGNPHLWMDPEYARAYVRAIASALEKADPPRAAAFAASAAAEDRSLVALERWIRTQVETIPPDHRAMITFHDAWYYFDRRFGIENVGAIEPSPGREPSPGYFAALIALARRHHVRAVFAEPQYSPKLAAALQSSAGIRVMTDLYDDTLEPSSGVGDYDAMMRYDVRTIVGALRP